MFWCPYCFPTFFAVSIFYFRTSIHPPRNGFFGISGMRHAFFGTTVYLDRVRSDRVLVLWAYRNCGDLSNQFKSFTLWTQSCLAHLPAVFNSSLVLPPCLRMRSAILGLPTVISSGGAPPVLLAFTSAPGAISSSAISMTNY